MLCGPRLGPLNALVRTPRNNSASSSGGLDVSSKALPQRLRENREAAKNPSHWFSLRPLRFLSATSGVKILPTWLSPKLLPRPGSPAPRRFCNPLPGLASHIHHTHAAFEVIGQRSPHRFELFGIFRGQHR